VSLIPFGGYCKLRGEEAKDRDEKTEKDPGAWYNKPPLSRFLTVIAGPVFNYLFAVIIMGALLYAGYKATYTSPQVMVPLMPGNKSTPAMLAGLQSGDTILSIDNKKIDNFEEILPAVMFNVGKEMEITYLHGGTTNHSHVTPVFNKQMGAADIGVIPLFYSFIGSVLSNTPAFNAGLRPGDRLESIDNVKTEYFYQLDSYIKHKTNGQDVTLVIARAGKGATNILTNTVKLSGFEGRGFLGIEPDNYQAPKFSKIIKSGSLYAAFTGGIKESDDLVAMTLKGLQAMITGKIDVRKSVGGPLRILQITGTIATRADLWYIFWFIAYISIALGFANILPLPGFDGGHAIISLGEFVSGRRLPDRARAAIETIGLVCILLLFVFVVQNDIVSMFFGR
jgi:regulator of sigma E protease